MNCMSGSVKDGEFPDCQNDSQLIIQLEAVDQHNNNTKKLHSICNNALLNNEFNNCISYRL